MRAKLLIVIVILGMLFPGVSHGFGILRFVCDGIANQLGLNRGPIPKVIQRPQPPGVDSHQATLPKHPDAYRVYIQAEGF
jgi:hypothetical protein